MKQQFNYIGVHKNNTRDQVSRTVTEKGMKCLRRMLEEARVRNENREELLGGKQNG